MQLPFVTITGQTTDQNGVPVSGVLVKADDYWSDSSALGQYQFRQVMTSVESDSDGHYRFVALAGLDAQTITPPTGSGFAQTVISEMNLQSSLEQSIILPFNDVIAPVITSAPRATDITDTGAVIQWQTDEPASSVVTVNGVAHRVPGFRMSHSVAVSGLSASQLYSATVASSDKDGNGPVSGSTSFTTQATPDIQVPVILEGPVVSFVAHDRAVVEWRTNEPATTALGYSVADGVQQAIKIDGLRNQHRVEVTGLQPETVYAAQVSSVDAAGNGPVSGQVGFQTLQAPDTSAPVYVSGPVITNISADSVTVEWQTDEPSVSAISLNDGTEYRVVRDETLDTEHAVTVTGLAAATQYTYTVSATDAVGNGPALSGEDSFRTQELADTQPPLVTEALKIVGITHQSAVVHWRTDEPADSTVEFGITSGQLGELASESKLKNKHVVQLTNLDRDTLYYLRAVSVDQHGNRVVTDEVSFTTRSLPDSAKPHFKKQPEVVGATDETITVAWETDEPADAAVVVKSGNGDVKSKANGKKSNRHTVTVTGLAAGESYSYVVEAKDSSGNVSRHESAAIVAEDFWQSGAVQLARALGVETASAATAVAKTTEAPDTVAPAFQLAPEFVWADSSRVVVEWISDEPASAELRYGVAGALDRVAAEVDAELEHQLVLAGLQPGLSYEYVLILTDVAGNETRHTGSFSAAASADTLAPLISSVVDYRPDTGVLDLEFATDELATATVRYGVKGGDLKYSISVVGYNHLHSVRIAGLDAAVDYAWEIEATDPAGNEAVYASAGPDTGEEGVDADGDGMPDAFELAHGLDPADSSDALLDADGDGVSNLDEYLAGTDPLSAPADDEEPATEINQIPVASLSVMQNGLQVALPTLKDGFVSVLVEVRDPDFGQSHQLDWSLTDNRLVPVQGSNAEAFVFDPAGLVAGVYFVRVTVTDDGASARSASYELPLRLIEGDSAGEDANGNGMPDALDLSPEGGRVYVPGLGELQASEGLRLRPAAVAVAANRLTPVVRWHELVRFGGEDAQPGRYVLDGYWRYEDVIDVSVHDLVQAGDSAQIMIPLREQVSTSGRLRIYHSDRGWQSFRQTMNNRIFSAVSTGVECAQLPQAEWQSGLTEGADCLRLLIQDGGPNDVDGQANGEVRITGGVGTDFQTFAIQNDRQAPWFTRPPVAAFPQRGLPSVQLQWATNEPVSVDLSVSTKGYEAERQLSLPAAASHEIPLTGLVPGRRYEYRLELTDKAGNQASYNGGFTVPSVPYRDRYRQSGRSTLRF
ncbi:chitodextrinase [Marinobacter sp. MBR-105]